MVQAAIRAVFMARLPASPSGVARSPPAHAQQRNTTFNRDQTGWTTRANFGFDFASNTAYGPLIGHLDINAETGNGFDTTGTATYVNTGYLTWAGITAGKAQSFYLVHRRRRQLGELLLARPEGLQRA